jgi:hypothetical protein
MGIVFKTNTVQEKECGVILSAVKEIGLPSKFSETDPSTGYYEKMILLEQDMFAYGVFQEICERVLSIAEEEFNLNLKIEQTALINVVPGNIPEEHADNQNLDGTSKLGCSDFVISAVIYLNDSFTGGDLVFPRIEYRHKPSPGDCLIFPSDLIHSHYVDNVLDGSRISLAIWFSGV